MNNKVLVVGAFSNDPAIYTYATSFYKTFQHLGFDTNYVNYRKPILLTTIPGINRITAAWAARSANNQIIASVKEHRPWLVFILKGESITPETLREIKKNCVRVVNFYPDNPFSLWNGNSTELILKSLPLYDCMLSWSDSLTPALLASGCNHVCNFPFAFDEEIFQTDYQPSSAELKAYASDVCFIGTWDPKREQLLNYAISKLPHLSFGIWGNHWQTKAQSSLVKKHIRGDAIYGQEMIIASHASKITLNIMRDQNSNAHNMRSFEIPAIKAFCLTEHTKQLTEVFFQEGFSIASFHNKEELVAQIEYYLKHDTKRILIANNAHKIAKNYTLKTQLSLYLKTCPTLL